MSYPSKNCQTNYFGHQTESTGEESQQVSTCQDSTKTALITDGPGHSILQALGQAQRGGDDGEGEAYVECKSITNDLVIGLIPRCNIKLIPRYVMITVDNY